MFALRANHDAVRVHQVGHRAAFAQKFGIADHVEFRAMPVIAFDGLAHLFAGFDGHRALVHDHAITRQDAGDLPRDFFDKAEIDAAVRLLRSRHGDEDNLRVLDAILNAAGEAKPLRRHISVNDFLQSGFIDGHLARPEGLYFSWIVIHADDVMANVGKAGAGDETDITGADDGNIHGGRK